MHASERTHFIFTSRSGFYQGWKNCQQGTIVKNRAEADADVCTALPEVQPPLLLRSETALHRSVIAQRRKYIFNVFIAVWRLLSVMLTETE